jgi:hypothetical protein
VLQCHLSLIVCAVVCIVSNLEPFPLYTVIVTCYNIPRGSTLQQLPRNLSHLTQPTAKMSIIQQNTTASLSDNWRTINIDALDPESSLNFDLASLYPAGNNTQISESDVRSLAVQVRQLLRGGDAEGALRGACEGAPVGNEPETVKVCE